jgi:hypothetical protein
VQRYRFISVTNCLFVLISATGSLDPTGTVLTPQPGTQTERLSPRLDLKPSGQTVTGSSSFGTVCTGTVSIGALLPLVLRISSVGDTRREW